MKNLILTLLLVTLQTLVFGQKASPNSNSFFESYEDYLNGKSVPDYKIETYFEFIEVIIEVTKKGKKERIKIDKLPYKWFTNKTGILIRVCEGDFYYVLVEGNICFYIKGSEGSVDYYNSDIPTVIRFQHDYLPRDYISETISGEIKMLKTKDRNKLLVQYGLKEQFDAEKVNREFKDDIDEYNSKVVAKTIRYIKLINEKLK